MSVPPASSLLTVAAFVLKPSKDKPKQLSTFLFSQHGADYEPSYTVRHLDPDNHASRNRYAAALYDAFSPEVLYAEVLLIPEWTQPPPLSEQARLNGAIPPPPEPILPSEFVIQLYNPDQQIVVRHKAASFNRSASWEFEMPQQTFRPPSGSALDRTQYDPAASEVTPKIVFKWKKDSKFSKDLACFMSGKSTDIEGKAKHRDPDITVSIFKALKELTLYEPNLQRVDIEDLKGFEVVLLLGAVVIRDVYFGSLKETFNLNVNKKSNPASPSTGPAILQTDARPQPVSPTHEPRVPPTDPRTQWEIEAESARLRRQALEEERQRRRREEEEERLTRQLLEREEKEQRRRKQAEIQQETERLKQMYGREDASARPDLPPRDPRQHRHHSEAGQSAYLETHQGQHPVAPYVNAWGGYSSGPYMSGAASQSSFLAPAPALQPQIKPKSSIFNFRRRSDQDTNKLQRKRSAVF
ncbi:hypothetical protein AYO20_09876 [Fonsecaea nubica]|uniref:Uncharacterized protein n=1 Tax=Fonsecaea nubica TaxID=856822 RepID=A0A178CAS4_9EURO|nr:hypothetical protein AYO20_09876 [Fonsecaea nubica]OAL27068.1 hypothetical protein AYO20_09876 [Fonsecaea nubica]